MTTCNGLLRAAASALRRRGNVAMLTAIAAVPLVALPGIAIDSARIWLVQSRLQVAVDAGVLAAARTMSVNSNTTDGISMFWANFQPLGSPDEIGRAHV